MNSERGRMSGSRSVIVGFVAIVVAFAVVALIAASGGGGDDDAGAPAPGRTSRSEPRSTTNASTPPTTAPIVVVRKPITVSATTTPRIKPIALSGSYAVRFKKTGNCSYVASLVSTSDPAHTTEIARTDKAAVVDANADALAAGNYFVEVITGPVASCGWTLTLTPV